MNQNRVKEVVCNQLHTISVKLMKHEMERRKMIMSKKDVQQIGHDT